MKIENQLLLVTISGKKWCYKAKRDNHKKSAQAYFFTTETNFNERSFVFFRVMNIPSLLKGNLHKDARVRVDLVNCMCQNR